MQNYSSGINIPQAITAGIESFLISKNSSDSLTMAGAVAASNLLPKGSYYKDDTEKYILEPIIAGILYAGVGYSMGKKGDLMKNFGKGFLVGSSSAVISVEALKKYNGLETSTVAKLREQQAVRAASSEPEVKAKAYKMPNLVIS